MTFVFYACFRFAMLFVKDLLGCVSHCSVEVGNYGININIFEINNYEWFKSPMGVVGGGGVRRCRVSYVAGAYSWARPALLVAGNGRGGMFLFLFLHFHSCSSFFRVLSFISYLFSFSL